MSGDRILLVEDDKEIREGVEIFLKSQGYAVFQAANGVEGLETLEREKIDLAIVDVMMPRMDGITMVAKLREKYDFPVLFLSAKSEEVDKILGLNMGADDYITKPFGVMELISRVKAMLRRSQKTQEKDKVLKLGNIVLDREKHSVTVGKEPVELTYKEYELLKLLMTNAGIVTTRELILDRVWGIDFEGESRTLDMHIKTLRQKLKEEGSLIKTVRNVGYIMNGEKA